MEEGTLSPKRIVYVITSLTAIGCGIGTALAMLANALRCEDAEIEAYEVSSVSDDKVVKDDPDIQF